MRRFVIRDVTKIAGMYGEDETITEVEFKKRLDEIRHCQFVTLDDDIEYLLYGEGEQLHKNIESLAKFADKQLDSPTPDEWEQLVDRMPMSPERYTNQLVWRDNMKQWFRDMGKIIREMPRGK